VYASLPKTFCNRRVVHSEENKKPDACGEWMVNQVFNDHLSPLEAKTRERTGIAQLGPRTGKNRLSKIQTRQNKKRNFQMLQNLV
jgi:hypothetical protein